MEDRKERGVGESREMLVAFSEWSLQKSIQRVVYTRAWNGISTLSSSNFHLAGKMKTIEGYLTTLVLEWHRFTRRNGVMMMVMKAVKACEISCSIVVIHIRSYHHIIGYP